MFIDLTKPRAQYFENPSVAEILRQFVQKDNHRAPITIADVRRLQQQGKIVVGTKEGTLESLLGEQRPEIDSLALVQSLAGLQPDQLLLLPQEYRIDRRQAQNVVAYSPETLLKLDSASVNQALLGQNAPSRRLSGWQKEQWQWYPEKVLAVAFNQLHEQKELYAERIFSSYSWYGRDNHRRVVSLYRAIQGAELRAFQNYVAYRLLIPTMKKEVRTGKNGRDSTLLSTEEIAIRQEKIQHYEHYVARRGLQRFFAQMDVAFTDLIEPQAKPFAYETAFVMRVPSRTNPPETHIFSLTSLPLVVDGDQKAYSMVWETRGKDNCADKIYRSDRRRAARFQGQDDDFFCAHEIAALHSLRKIYEKKEKRIPFLPLVLPTASMMDYVEKLRWQTIMVVRNPETGRSSKQALNHTEIENLLFKKVMVEGYEACFTADLGRFKDQKYDPHLDLIKFCR